MLIARDIQRILVIRRRALGDALVNLPAVRELVAGFPEAKIDLLIDRPFVPLFESLDTGCRVRSWPDVGTFSWLRGYDLVVDFLSTPRTALWTAISGARWRVGYDLPWRRWAYNVRIPRNRLVDSHLQQFAGEAFLDVLRGLGFQPGSWRPSPLNRETTGSLGAAYLSWRGEILSRAQKDRRPLVTLVMSATWPAKAWPVESAVELVALLQARGVVPVLAPGPGDELHTGQMKSLVSNLIIAPPTGLHELSDLLSRVDVHIGTDNGSRHLAAALGVPTVTLFGPTDPTGWNPRRPDHVSVFRDLDCRPCNLIHCPLPGHPQDIAGC